LHNIIQETQKKSSKKQSIKKLSPPVLGEAWVF